MVGQEFDGDLTRQQLQTLTPYNTYRINGLPPTPIALPGESSIIASLNPDPGDCISSLARRDPSILCVARGHNAAVNQFQNTRQRETVVRRKGLFITVEGVEGAGKSTNIKVIEFLSEWKLDYVLTGSQVEH